MSKEQVELSFWMGHYLQNKDGYEELRLNDINKYKFLFDEVTKEKGKGLDYGCGLYSMFGDKVDAYDPLMEEYRKIIDLPPNHISEVKGKYDWVWCVNVVDHTAYPEEIISHIKKHLKKGGRLYFEVNFDDMISPAHYHLWNEQMVKDLLKDFKLIDSHSFRNNEYPQTVFMAIYEN